MPTAVFKFKHILVAYVALGAVALVYVLIASFGTSIIGDSDAPVGGDMVKFVVNADRPSLPGGDFVGPDGKSTDLSAHKGRVVLLNFWATWCPPCLTEMASLDHLQAKLGGDAFEVVAVNLDRNPAEARAWLKRHDIRNLPFFGDKTMRMHLTFGATGLPTTFLVDPEGREIGRLAGPAEWDADDAVELVTGYLPAQ
jgi:thiol-disulfide isomerase/thioredoxin